MDLFEIKNQISSLQDNADLLIKQYERIVDELSKIYKVFAKTDFDEADKIMSLIDKHNSLISTMRKDYHESSEKILDYVDSSNQNLQKFRDNLRLTGEIFEKNVHSTNSEDLR